MKVAVILGTTRDGRAGERVAKWVMKASEQMDNWETQLIDLAELDLPFYHDAVLPGMMNRNYPDERVTEWSRLIDAADAFIFLTPEYNHSLPAPLKNALDWLYPEWSDKAAAIVSYSGVPTGGVRAGEALRTVLAQLGVATVQAHTAIASIYDNVAEDGTAKVDALNNTLQNAFTQLERWGSALMVVRQPA